MYYEEEYYYEPTVADEIITEFQNKMKEVLLDSVKADIENIKQENIKLRKENEELRELKYNIQRKESELKQRENELERNFYRNKFSEMLSSLVEKYIGYQVDRKYYTPEKCNMCNENRQIVFKSDHGKTITQTCDCNKRKGYYAPEQTELEKLDLTKDRNNRKFIVTPQYENKAEDDERWSALRLRKIVDKFDIEESKNISRWSTVFVSKEECQKYCDWLNLNESNRR